MVANPIHPLLVHLPAEQSRRALAIVNRADSAYSSLSEFIAVAVENQLGLEEVAEVGARDAPTASAARPPFTETQARRRGKARRSSPPTSRRSKPTTVIRSAPPDAALDLLRRPDPGELATRPATLPGEDALSPFTNRLNPLVAGARVLVNMVATEGPPSVERFVEQASAAARAQGLRLRVADEEAGRRGRHRRWTAWPVGDDEAKTLTRFRKSFLLWPEQDRAAGPLVELGLVVAVDGLVYPTPAGVELATGTIPVLDDDSGEVLLEPQRAILAEGVVALPGEQAEITTFLDAVDATGGVQEAVDKHVSHRHPDWSEAQLVTQRAAMVGRLRDLLVIDVDPQPGAKTVIVAGPQDQPFRQLLANSPVAATDAPTEE